MEPTSVAVAVMPFENESSDISQDYFARGFVDDLAIELSRFPTLEIIHAQSALPNAGEISTPYRLRGSVRRVEDIVRIYAQVVDSTGRQVWSDRFDAPAERLFEVQNEIVTQVASRLAGKIQNERLRKARRKPLANLEVYDCWLRGIDCLHRGTPQADAEARIFFERSLSLDPNYARGYAGISLSHFNEWSCQAWELWDDKEQLAFHNARRAAELEDQDALIQLILGRILLYRRRFDEAIRHVDRAIELNPNDADVLAHAAVCHGFLGDPALGLTLVTKAMRLNPHYPDWYVGSAALAHFVLGHHAEALGLMARTPAVTVDVPAYQAAALALSGDVAGAAAPLERFLADFQEKITFGRRPEPGEPLRWLMQVNPFRRREDSAQFERGLKLAGLRGDPDEERAGTSPRTGGRNSTQPVFRKEGDVWHLGFDGLALQLIDMKGFHDLAQLIARPQETIHCLDLAGRSSESSGDDVMLDARARRELTERVKTLQTEIDEAEVFHDTGRAERARQELDQIVSTLSQALGLAGKPRRLGSAVERARTAVTWRIRSAIRKAIAVHPALGRHLENSVRTGTYCAYAPEKPLDWVL
ncbi:MAG TPA: tetratricopeptide repeat protein [Terriglobia bacterium]|nr:tetratricopeptide repeat protein [Terriglobia bacterium]